jgi:hypothetical protein
VIETKRSQEDRTGNSIKLAATVVLTITVGGVGSATATLLIVLMVVVVIVGEGEFQFTRVLFVNGGVGCDILFFSSTGNIRIPNSGKKRKVLT